MKHFHLDNPSPTSGNVKRGTSRWMVYRRDLTEFGHNLALRSEVPRGLIRGLTHVGEGREPRSYFESEVVVVVLERNIQRTAAFTFEWCDAATPLIWESSLPACRKRTHEARRDDLTGSTEYQKRADLTNDKSPQIGVIGFSRGWPAGDADQEKRRADLFEPFSPCPGILLDAESVTCGSRPCRGHRPVNNGHRG